MGNSDANLPFWFALLSIQEQATRDWLTGLHNRRYFEETLPEHIEAANRYKRELSLVLFDLDGFKAINDSLGHEAGDTALRRFSDILKKTARKADIICRLGGDEFAVILPETSKSNAERFAERIADAIAATSESAMPAIPFSATAGIAALPSENLLADADAELLNRKGGR